MKCVTLITLMTLLCFTDAKKRSLSEVTRFLNAASNRNAVLKFDDETLDDVVGRETIPRNYSLALMMTMSTHQCQNCQKPYENYELIASSWRNSKPTLSKLFFGCVFAEDSQALFEKYKISYVPVLLLFNEYDDIDTPGISYLRDYSTESIRKWIARETGIKITIVKPFDLSLIWSYKTYLTPFIILLIMRVTVLRLLNSRTFWAILALAFVFTMTSGQMFNRIKEAQYGGADYGQSEVEIYVIIAINSSITLLMILMTESLKRNESVPKKEVTATGCTLLTAILISYLLQVFRWKNNAYPFKFLF